MPAHRSSPGSSKRDHSRSTHRREDDGGGGAHGTEEGGVSGAKLGGGRHSVRLSANEYRVAKALQHPASRLHSRIAFRGRSEIEFSRLLHRSAVKLHRPVRLGCAVGAVDADAGAVYSLDRCLGWLAGAERRWTMTAVGDSAGGTARQPSPGNSALALVA